METVVNKVSKKELSAIRKAIRNMRTEKDTFYMEGRRAICRWNGKSFTWTVNGRIYENCTAKEVINWIDDGRYIKDYCYDYGN